jgi:GTP-binding protein YchF
MLSAGLIGLPNVGKSTLFNALSTATAEADNYPFCTIDPNVGVIEVPDPRLHKIAERIDPEEAVPAAVEFYDIAGLVEGASEGEGLGNQFLANIRETDALVHVVRCFDDDDVAHVEETVDPVRDVNIIENELILADLETVEKRLDKAKRAAKSGDKDDILEAETVETLHSILQDGQPARTFDADSRQQPIVDDLHLLSDKPVLFVANVGDDDLLAGNDHVDALREAAGERGGEVMTICAELESELAELDDAERREMLAEFGIDEPALDALVRQTYDLLGLQSFFTMANDKLRAWTVPVGASAPEAAGVVHSDFEQHFIRAEVFTVEDLVELGDEAAIRDAGRMRVEGKDYIVQDGDILRIRHDA